MVKDQAVEALLARAQSRPATLALPWKTPHDRRRRRYNFTSAMGVPTLDGLGADGDTLHTLHEHILVSTLEPARLNFWRPFARATWLRTCSGRKRRFTRPPS